MPSPNEIVEVPAGVIDGVNVDYTTQRPYIPGSLSVYANGLLAKQTSDDGWFELVPSAGTFQLKEALFPVSPGEPPGDVLQVAYLDASYRPLFEDPEKPIHITEVKHPDVLRIAMKPGYHLVPYMHLSERRAASGRPRAAKNTSRTVFLGYVLANNPQNGLLTLDIQDRDRTHMTAFVEYAHILVIQRYITPARLIPDQGSRPGSHAFGTTRLGFMKLVQVRL